MIVRELLSPNSIAIIGASNEVQKPGGKILKNILDNKFDGAVYAVNPKEESVQGVKCFKSVDELPEVELAVLAIASKFCYQTIEILAKQKNTKAFIILSAGFSEMGEEGAKLEKDIAALVDSVGGSLIGPNCIGVLTPRYAGVFAGPVPKLEPQGVDFVTGSGATAVFILELAITRGLTFASLFSVGNSAQIGVEDVLAYWDETFDPGTSSKVKMLYMEKIHNPKKFLVHAQSLINKGCQIAAIKSGCTEAGSRAVSSHTGALAGSDAPVEALFQKAGIVRCTSRSELVEVANVMMHKPLTGKNIAVITHAGGPGVLLTDQLSKEGLQAPHIQGEAADELLSKLFHGSSVANPIDFLATGTAENLDMILDYVENKFDDIDGAAVIFGSTGMFDVTPVYDVLHERMKTGKKPIYPILPSIVQEPKAIAHFINLGRSYFVDECDFAKGLGKVINTPAPSCEVNLPEIDKVKVRAIVDAAENGYLAPEKVQELLDAAGISRAKEATAVTKEEAMHAAKEIGFPLVMKVVGPVHKSDVGGVKLNIHDGQTVAETFEAMMEIKDAVGVLMQPMLSGLELFVGAKKEDPFGHLILFGMGGIFIEVLKDFAQVLSPISKESALAKIRGLKSYKMIQGARGKEGVNEEMFADNIVRLSALLEVAQEIFEMDINPLLGRANSVTAVDARIRIEK